MDKEAGAYWIHVESALQISGSSFIAVGLFLPLSAWYCLATSLTLDMRYIVGFGGLSEIER